jgi:DNA primase
MSRASIKRLVELSIPLTPKRLDKYVGPCPWHSSKSGTCLVVWDDEARWWCSSCKRGGDAVAWVQLLEGLNYRQALERLGLARPLLRRVRPKAGEVRA